MPKFSNGDLHPESRRTEVAQTLQGKRYNAVIAAEAHAGRGWFLHVEPLLQPVYLPERPEGKGIGDTIENVALGVTKNKKKHTWVYRASTQFDFALPKTKGPTPSKKEKLALEQEARKAKRQGKDPKLPNIDTLFAGAPAGTPAPQAPAPMAMGSLDLAPPFVLSSPPSSTWELLIDESGSSPEEMRVVGVLVPEHSTLPPVEVHAVEEPHKGLEAAKKIIAAQDVLILGLHASTLPSKEFNTWFRLILEVSEWLLLLLPLSQHDQHEPQSPILIRLRAEQSGHFDSRANLDMIIQEALRRVELARPEIRGRFKVEARFITKKTHKWISYADALGHIWYQGQPLTKMFWRKNRDLHRVLLEHVPSVVSSLKVRILAGTGIHGSEVVDAIAVCSQGGGQETSLDRFVLDLIREHLRKDADLWRATLAAVRTKLDTSDMDPAQVFQITRWLADYRPAEVEASHTDELLLLTCKLSASNYTGAVASARRIADLCEALQDEEPRLVAQARLHLAVTQTNRFNFEAASNILSIYVEQPPALAGGLRTYAQMLSSLGQHAAFRGENEEAEGYFDEALAAFSSLSDGKVVAFEGRKTSCYRALNAMSRKQVTRKSALAALESTLECTLEEAIEWVGYEDLTAWDEHLLLRFLTSFGMKKDLRAYLERQEDWVENLNHPWQLILLYRAIILMSEGKVASAKQEATKALALCRRPEAGPTLNVVGLAIAAILRSWGVESPTTPQTSAEQLAQVMPHAQRWLNVISDGRSPGESEVAFLARALPFNFR